MLRFRILSSIFLLGLWPLFRPIEAHAFMDSLCASMVSSEDVSFANAYFDSLRSETARERALAQIDPKSRKQIDAGLPQLLSALDKTRGLTAKITSCEFKNVMGKFRKVRITFAWVKNPEMYEGVLAWEEIQSRRTITKIAVQPVPEEEKKLMADFFEAETFTGQVGRILEFLIPGLILAFVAWKLIKRQRKRGPL